MEKDEHVQILDKLMFEDWLYIPEPFVDEDEFLGKNKHIFELIDLEKF